MITLWYFPRQSLLKLCCHLFLDFTRIGAAVKPPFLLVLEARISEAVGPPRAFIDSQASTSNIAYAEPGFTIVNRQSSIGDGLGALRMQMIGD